MAMATPRLGCGRRLTRRRLFDRIATVVDDTTGPGR
jgi:hypothetical protein